MPIATPRLWPWLCLLGLAAVPLAAQPAPDSAAVDPAQAPLFADDAPLRLTLAADFKALRNDRDDEAPYREATLLVHDPPPPAHLELKVRTRGKFRRMKKNCDFPPLRLNFKKKQVHGTVFAGQDKLKLVTHCRQRDDYEQYVLLEYLIYRTYNLFTEYSFRVRLARITYEDTSGKDKPITRYAFLIEDDDHLAARTGRVEREIRGIPQYRIDPEVMAQLEVFQFMIGNLDWSVPSLHNIVLLFAEPPTPPVAVPYDFDFSGLVNARYATPPEQFAYLRSVRERLYRGFCRPEEQLRAVLERFREKKEAILALYRDFPPLEGWARRQAVDYLEEFFELIEDPDEALWTFRTSCRRIGG